MFSIHTPYGIEAQTTQVDCRELTNSRLGSAFRRHSQSTAPVLEIKREGPCGLRLPARARLPSKVREVFISATVSVRVSPRPAPLMAVKISQEQFADRVTVA